MASLPCPKTALVLTTLVFYVLFLVIYRLFFSSLSKIPGPKIAAITSLYAFYHDVVLGGQYIWAIEKMHAEYGPIVRIRPDVLHVNDPTFIDQIYGTAGKRRDKYKIEMGGFCIPGAALGTTDHDLHRSRRAALNPYFSKGSIHRLEPILKKTLKKILDRFEASAVSGEVVKLNLLSCAATNDVISEYCFGKGSGNLDKDDLNEPLFDAMAGGAKIYHFATFVPWFLPVLIFGLGIMGKFKIANNDEGAPPDFVDDLKKKIEVVRDETKSEDAEKMGTTIFHGILTNPNLPESEKATSRLINEAQVMMGAGTDTTAGTLVAITYHLLANPPILKKLKKELDEAIPNTDIMPDASQIQALPYLTAVIQEGLRLHAGVCLRQERVAPDEELFYEDVKSGKKYIIPRGTAIGMTPTILSMSEEYYPIPYEFKPERYLDNPRLDRYQLTFSRGSRRCIGINLAYSEMYLVLAGIFRKYDLYDGTGDQSSPTLDLFNTDRGDVDMAADFVSPFVKHGSLGVKLRVRNA